MADALGLTVDTGVELTRWDAANKRLVKVEVLPELSVVCGEREGRIRE